MAVYLYFSLIPEALIASNLPPEKFGRYYATGSSYKSKGQCLFFAVDIDFRSPYFDVEAALARCVPAADGRPPASHIRPNSGPRAYKGHFILRRSMGFLFCREIQCGPRVPLRCNAARSVN